MPAHIHIHADTTSKSDLKERKKKPTCVIEACGDRIEATGPALAAFNPSDINGLLDRNLLGHGAQLKSLI